MARQTREAILAEIERLDGDATITELKQSIKRDRAFVEAHELTRAKRRIVANAHRLEVAETQRHQHRDRLLRQLESAEPAALRDLRETVDGLFSAHRATDPPPPPNDRLGHGPDNTGRARAMAWIRRGESLATLRRELHTLWREADWQERVKVLLAEHAANVVELRRFSVEEPANA